MPENAVARYYQSVTDEYLRYGNGHGWHYGIWDGSNDTHEGSLKRATEVLFGGLTLDESTRILDVGCGCGDLAHWCASRYGSQVFGVTIVPQHVELAERRCAAVGDRVRFALMDMNELDLEPGSFDIVINQETLCYARDLVGYLGDVHRALVPGGWWRAIEFSRLDAIEDPVDLDQYERTLAGFEIPRLHTQDEVGQALRRAGFEDRGVGDLTASVRPTAKLIIAEARQFESLAAVGGQWIVPGQLDSPAQVYGHFDAGRAYSEGLLSGWARHLYFEARRPPV